jgi:uncharacterized damage-inducible protein DinB
MANQPDSMVVDFLQYNRWANLQLIDVCAGLSSEQLDTRAAGVYGSIHDTLRHIIRAEASYYKRLTGVPLQPSFQWEQNPSLPEMRSYAEQVSSALVDAARQVQSSDLIDLEWDEQKYRFKSVALLIQVVNHGVEHRTNITTILAQLGIESPQIDGWGYIMSIEDWRIG